jgi:lysophospholipase L1-like esterase
MDESVPDKTTIFLGDSITQGLATAAVVPCSINYGIAGENTAQLLDAIPSYKSLARANAIVLTIGINDLEQGMNVGLNNRYQKIVEALPQQTPLIWSAVMPAKNIALSDINNANQSIKSLCASRGNCVFVDTWRFLADKNGYMITRLFLDDGVHLSTEGYRAWILSLKQAIQDIPLANTHSITSPTLRDKAAQSW